MKTFKLTADITIGVSTEVEAETLEEAIEIADQRGDSVESASLDVDFQKEQMKSVWIVHEYDGMPINIKEEDE
jgi:hypothetical protein